MTLKELAKKAVKRAKEAAKKDDIKEGEDGWEDYVIDELVTEAVQVAENWDVSELLSKADSNTLLEAAEATFGREELNKFAQEVAFHVLMEHA